MEDMANMLLMFEAVVDEVILFSDDTRSSQPVELSFEYIAIHVI